MSEKGFSSRLSTPVADALAGRLPDRWWRCEGCGFDHSDGSLVGPCPACEESCGVVPRILTPAEVKARRAPTPDGEGTGRV